LKLTTNKKHNQKPNMKKLFILSSVAALGAISAMGQGQVNLNNGGTGVLLQIQDTRGIINGGAAATIGTPATTAGFTGAGPGQIAITVWGAPQGTLTATVESTTPLFSGFNSASALAGAQGTYSAGASGTAFNLTTANVPGWNGSGPLEFIITESVTAAGVAFKGFGEAQNITAATGIATPTPIFGNGAGQIGSLVLTPQVPEPTSIALGGLGAAALLLFRRRK
jgi:hypothetical protein